MDEKLRLSLPEDIRGEKSFDDIKGATWDEAGPIVAKSFVNAQKMLGGRVPLPTKPEEVEAWKKDHLPKLYTAGVLEAPPSKPEEYGVDRPEKVEEETFKEFVAHAHKSGMNKSTVKAVVDWYSGHLSKMDAAIEKGHNDAVEALKKEFGIGYDEKVAIAQRAVAKYATPGLRSKMDIYRLGDDPDMIKFWVEYATLKGEDAVIKGTSKQQGGTADQARAKIDEINSHVNDKDHPYWNDKHPDHKKAVDEMAALFKQLS
jgi:hypothetical protein